MDQSYRVRWSLSCPFATDDELTERPFTYVFANPDRQGIEPSTAWDSGSPVPSLVAQVGVHPRRELVRLPCDPPGVRHAVAVGLGTDEADQRGSATADRHRLQGALYDALNARFLMAEKPGPQTIQVRAAVTQAKGRACGRRGDAISPPACPSSGSGRPAWDRTTP